MRKYFFILLTLLVYSCDRPPATENGEETVVVLRDEWPNGKTKTEIPMKGKLRHGVAKNYYNSGALKQEINYTEGVKQGRSVYYYENGKPYRISSYTDDLADGVREVYWESGRKKAEIPLRMGQVCTGLKEYTTEGELITDYPTLRVNEIDEIFTRELFTLEVYPSSRVRKIEFYRGRLGEGGCFDPSNAISVIPQEDQLLKIYFPMPKGTFRMEEIELLAKITTDNGSPYLIQKIYPIAVENRN